MRKAVCGNRYWLSMARSLDARCAAGECGFAISPVFGEVRGVGGPDENGWARQFLWVVLFERGNIAWLNVIGTRPVRASRGLCLRPRLVSFHHTVKPPVQFPRRPAARDLLLVRLAFWIGIVTALSLVIWAS